ncbi:MAG: biotin--[acetyl-CoA-carboxylase] ligase [Bacteroidota bacterium]
MNTLFVGQVVHRLPEVASTNDHAFALLSKSKPPEGTVISAAEQTAGRGQIGSGWESEPGKNLTLSFIFYPEFLPANRQFLLSQAISLGVFDFISNELLSFSGMPPVFIKWSNDIYIGDKKVVGILIQNILIGSILRSSVVGIGININQIVFLTNPPNPTSLKLETGSDFDLEILLADLCSCLEKRYLQLKSQKISLLRQDYLSHLYRLHQPAFYQRSNGEIFRGTIAGVAESGKLEMVLEAGGIEYFDLKEIRFL